MKVKYGQNTIMDDDEKTSVTLRTSKKMLEYDLQVQASGGGGASVQFLGMYDMNKNYRINAPAVVLSSDCLIIEKEA